MVRTAIRKNNIREIFRSPGRYFAILGIILLGAGFFTGLRVTRDAIVKTADTYFDRTAFYDYQLISTLGYTEREVEAIRSRGIAEAVEGAYTKDLLVALTEEDVAVHFMSLPNDVNKADLVKGRLPEKSGEILIDRYMSGGFEIGDEIALSDQNTAEDLESLAADSFTIVGMVSSPLFLNYERGSTSIGSGSISFFAYILPEDFTGDTYTSIYLRLGDLGFLYSDEYEKAADAAEDSVRQIAEEQAHERYVRLTEENTAKLRKGEWDYYFGKNKYYYEKEKAEKELSDAEEQLKDAQAELVNGRTELDSGRQELDEARLKAEEEFAKAEKTLNDALNQLRAGETAYAQGLASYQAGQAQYAAGLSRYNDSVSQYSDVFDLLEVYNNFQMESNDVQTALTALMSEMTQIGVSEGMTLDEQLAAVDAYWNENEDDILDRMGTLADSADALADALQVYTGNTQELKEFRSRIAAIRDLIKNKDKVDDSAAKIRSLITSVRDLYSSASNLMNSLASRAQGAQAELAKAAAELTKAKKQLDAAKKQVDAARVKLDNGWQEYFDGAAELDRQRADAEKQFAEAEAELADAEKQLEDGQKEYEDGLVKLEEGKAEAEKQFADGLAELNDARAKLDDGWQQLRDLKEPTVYALGRWANIGYSCLNNDSMIVSNVAKVFPFFFFLVAALICITTMTRMVEEQRGQLGVLEALGYSRATVMSKYLFYAGSASLLGCGIGIPFLSWLFPQLIWQAYRIMYNFSHHLEYVMDWKLAIITTVGYVAAIMLVTGLTLAGLLKQVPAALMRPKAPKLGKRVLLERIPLIWNRLSFMWKVTLRNIFRYRSRVLMMLLGVAGCTALMITGYGIRDSISDVVTYQYSEVTLYEYEVTFSEEPDADAQSDFARMAVRYSGDSLFVGSFNAAARKEKTDMDLTLITSDSADAFSNYIALHRGGEKLPFPGRGEAVINNAAADDLKVKIGDPVTLVLDDREYQLTVSGIFDNYIYNYLLITDETYEDLTGSLPEHKTAFVLHRDGASDATARLLNFPGVLNVTAGSVMKDRIGGIMDNLIYIVLLTIVCAAALAFIVIYNLINININERLREIATVKVLGFYRGEAAIYVLRENLLLTLLGAIAGIPLGILLNRFVMGSIQVDLVSFIPRVKFPSFVWSVFFTLLFSFLVYLIMMRRLEKIDMASALKAAE